jgi:hypothetical protein
VGPRAVLDAVMEEINSQPLPGIEPLIIQLVAQHYTAELSRLPFFLLYTRNWNFHINDQQKKNFNFILENVSNTVHVLRK